ncbi:MAG: sigma-70 family RNA polymerase sigma factor [Planctomycetota bacterium]|nr:MAG: sigma-70 family RNA polymerase sigma factor [Planctomycetota bacterium]
MQYESRRRDKEDLYWKLGTEEFRKMLAGLQKCEPFMQQFRTWKDVIKFMRKGTSQDPRKSEVLRAILQAFASNNDPRWHNILLAIFWPGLCSIDKRKAKWDENDEERWQNITTTFIEVICRIDLSKRSERLVQKIYNDTVHRFYDRCSRAWKNIGVETTADEAELIELAGGAEDLNFDLIELHEAQETAIERLREYLVAGRIKEPDFHLLVGTRIYGKTIREYAREAGINYQTAKKRRQRAEAALRLVEWWKP